MDDKTVKYFFLIFNFTKKKCKIGNKLFFFREIKKKSTVRLL